MNEVGQQTPIVIDVTLVDTYLDGGTKKFVSSDGKFYFVDHRIGTSTDCAIFDIYPSADGAGVLENYRLNIITPPVINPPTQINQTPE